MLEFFGLSKESNGQYGYLREAEGAWSFGHIFVVTTLILLMIALAIFVGLKFKNKPYESKNKVLVWAAILINAFESLSAIRNATIEELEAVSGLNRLVARSVYEFYKEKREKNEI